MLDFLLGKPRRASTGNSPWGSSGYNMGQGGRQTQAGTVVDQQLALTYSACWCATRILSETPAGLPLALMRRSEDGGSEHARDLPLYDLLKTSPNPDMGSMAFREGRFVHQLNWGNGFGEIQREKENDPKSPVEAFWPIHPGRVRPVYPEDRDSRGRPLNSYRYVVRNNDGSSVALRADEVLHFPGCLSEDGIWGKSIVAYGRESIGFGLGTERHGATQFGSGNTPRVVAFLPGMKDAEARKNYRREWKDMHGSPDAGEVAILPVDGKIQQLTFSNEAAQFLQTRAFNVKEIARWYRLPVHMLVEMLGPAGYNSLEQFSLEFVIYSLMPWLLRWEEQLELKLLTPVQRKTLYIEHQLAGLLRGNQKDRNEAYRVGLESGWLTINIVKRLEGLPTIGPAGDQHFVMSNMTTAERIYKGEPPPSASVAVEKPEKPPSRKSPSAVSDAVQASDAVQTLLDAADPRQAVLPAARVVLVDALRRAYAREANGALRAATTDLDAWLAERGPDHVVFLRECLGPAFAVLVAAGAKVDSEKVCQCLVADSSAALTSAYGKDNPEKFKARLGKWSKRAEDAADGIIKEAVQHG